jgi:hypothetical protein
LGIPDCLIALNDKFLMVELKVAEPSGKVKLRPHQVAFQAAHKDCPCYVLVQAGSGRAAELLLYQARQAEELSKIGTLLHPWFRMPYPFNWENLEKVLDTR